VLFSFLKNGNFNFSDVERKAILAVAMEQGAKRNIPLFHQNPYNKQCFHWGTNRGIQKHIEIIVKAYKVPKHRRGGGTPRKFG